MSEYVSKSADWSLLWSLAARVEAKSVKCTSRAFCIGSERKDQARVKCACECNRFSIRLQNSRLSPYSTSKIYSLTLGWYRAGCVHICSSQYHRAGGKSDPRKTFDAGKRRRMSSHPGAHLERYKNHQCYLDHRLPIYVDKTWFVELSRVTIIWKAWRYGDWCTPLTYPHALCLNCHSSTYYYRMLYRRGVVDGHMNNVSKAPS